MSAHRLFSLVRLSSGGNERVRIEASRRALSVVGETKREGTLSKRYPLRLSVPLSLASVSLSSSLPSFPGSPLRFSCRAEVNVQAHGVTEITHTLVANPLGCDSPSRLYLASNCSFFFNDARRSTCRAPDFARAHAHDELSSSRLRIHSERTFDSSDETRRVAF